MQAIRTAMVRELFEDGIGSHEALLQLPVLVVVEDLLEKSGLLGRERSTWGYPGRRHKEGSEESDECDGVEREGVYGRAATLARRSRRDPA